ncbi:hexosaminidase D-like [Glandiceps talaboti]
MYKDNPMRLTIDRQCRTVIILSLFGLLLIKILFSIWCVHEPKEPQLIKELSKPTHQQDYASKLKKPKKYRMTDLMDITEPLYRKPVKVPSPDSYHRLVHLDLKGAPPKIQYLIQMIPRYAKLGATGLLVEYEDMFPYQGKLDILRQTDAYSLDDLKLLQQTAKENQLEYIPLIQSFGHFEFVLKHERFASLREVMNYVQSLCPSNPESQEVLKLLIDQVMAAHQHTSYLHIGGDEVGHLGYCEACQRRLETEFHDNRDELFLSHIVWVLQYIREKYPHVQVIMWEDMLRHISEDTLQAYNLGELVEPMVWNYKWNIHLFHKFLTPNVWRKYGTVFHNIWVASAFKGATGVAQYYTDITKHIGNHHLWIDEINQSFPAGVNFRGYALTGWQRYDHHAVLCELLPSAQPSLAFCLQTLIHGGFNEQIHTDISRTLGFQKRLELGIEIAGSKHGKSLNKTGTFPGSAIYAGVTALMYLEHSTDMNKLYGNPSSRLEGWMTEYQLQHGTMDHSNMERISVMSSELLTLLGNIKDEMGMALPEVFEERTVTEWIMTRIDPLMKKLGEIQELSQKYMTKGEK